MYRSQASMLLYTPCCARCAVQPTCCAGLMASYWGGKYMALRRAQKPSALGDDVTGAINLLVRLLPLVQLILMYHMYFQVP